MAKVQCDVCKKFFKDEHAVNQHKKDAHKSIPKEKKSISKAFVITILIFLLIIAGIGTIIYNVVEEIQYCKVADVRELSIRDHSSITEHFHANLEIIVDGEEVMIPSSIGVTSQFMRPIHTHDTKGELHLEGPCKRSYVLGDFFLIWGEQLSDTCLLDNCGGTVTLTVDGEAQDEIANFELRDGQRLTLEYTS